MFHLQATDINDLDAVEAEISKPMGLVVGSRAHLQEDESKARQKRGELLLDHLLDEALHVCDHLLALWRTAARETKAALDGVGAAWPSNAQLRSRFGGETAHIRFPRASMVYRMGRAMAGRRPWIAHGSIWDRR